MSTFPPEIVLKILSSPSLRAIDIVNCILSGPPLTACAEESLLIRLPVDGRRHVLSWLKYFDKRDYARVWPRELRISVTSCTQQLVKWNRLIGLFPNLEFITFSRTDLRVFVEAWKQYTLKPLRIRFVDCEIDSHGLRMLLHLPHVSSVDVSSGNMRSLCMVHRPLVRARDVQYIPRLSIENMTLDAAMSVASHFPTSEPTVKCLTWQVTYEMGTILQPLDVGVVDRFLCELRIHIKGTIYICIAGFDLTGV